METVATVERVRRGRRRLEMNMAADRRDDQVIRTDHGSITGIGVG
jgi:hypothetical protein